MKKVSWKFNDSIESLLANNNELNINLSLESRDKIFDSSISFFSSDISNIDSLKLLRFLSIDEINHYNSIESDGQKRKFLDSNICSKYSIANLSKYQNLEDIEIYRGIFGQPYVIFQQYPKFDISIANKIIAGSLSVRQTEELCSNLTEELFPDQKKIKESKIDIQESNKKIEYLTNKLRNIMGSNIKIKSQFNPNKNKGKITISYNDLNEISNIIDLIDTNKNNAS